MAGGAADCAKEPAAVSDRGRSSRRSSGGCGLVGELHEGNEQPNVTGHCGSAGTTRVGNRSEEHTSKPQSRGHPVCRLLLEKKKKDFMYQHPTFTPCV